MSSYLYIFSNMGRLAIAMGGDTEKVHKREESCDYFL
jgi:hypothetical protein